MDKLSGGAQGSFRNHFFLLYFLHIGHAPPLMHLSWSTLAWEWGGEQGLSLCLTTGPSTVFNFAFIILL